MLVQPYEVSPPFYWVLKKRKEEKEMEKKEKEGIS